MTTVRVRMKTTTDGSPDGFTVNTYKGGQCYDLPPSLAKAFIEDLGVAVEVGKKKPEPSENKARKGAKENK